MNGLNLGAAHPKQKADRERRGLVVFDAMAERLAMQGGCTVPHARKLLHIVYALIKAEIAGGLFILPGALIIRRKREEIRRGMCRYKATVTLDKNTRMKAKAHEYRKVRKRNLPTEVIKGEVKPTRGKNKISRTAKDNIALVFDRMGGVSGMLTWAKANADEFYGKVYPKLLGIQVVGAGPNGEHLIIPVLNVTLSDDL